MEVVMKNKNPPKGRNMAAKALRSCKIFAHKVLPVKKGKGVIYSRKSRNADSGSYLLWTPLNCNIAYF